MGIKVISQDTKERKKETEELFKQVEPYLQKGYTLANAVQIIKQTSHNKYYNQAWFKELRTYAETKGYYSKR